MKSVSISKLKRLSAEEIKSGGCFEVTSDGEVVAQVIVGAMSGMIAKIRALASQIDAARGL